MSNELTAIQLEALEQAWEEWNGSRGFDRLLNIAQDKLKPKISEGELLCSISRKYTRDIYIEWNELSVEDKSEWQNIAEEFNKLTKAP